MNEQNKNEQVKVANNPKKEATQQSSKELQTTSNPERARTAQSKKELSQFKPAKQMIDIQKASVEAAINGLSMIWEQSAVFFEGATWLPEEGRKAVRQFADVNKKTLEGFRCAIDSGYSDLEKFLPL